MNRLILAGRRAAALFRMRSIEIRLHDQNEAAACVRDDESLLAIVAARQITRRELAKARADYNALLPAGERRTWGIA